MATGIPIDFDLEKHVRGTLYGNLVGDAIGLLSEFMDKEEAEENYGQHKELEYEHVMKDSHRRRFTTGDWTDDSDQMILIMDTLIAHKKIDIVDYAKKLKQWARQGFFELGDVAGMGLGATTSCVLRHEKYETDPHAASADIWEKSNRQAAPNGCVMRTSVLGVYQYASIPDVIENAIQICKVTHADPRCVASCVAVTTCISYMLQRQDQHLNKDGTYNIDELIKDAYNHAKQYIPSKLIKNPRDELKKHMNAKNIKDLALADRDKIGYCYKCMGSGFWALKQNDFRTALQTIVLEGGDADTNGAVAGAMLACKLGVDAIPESWITGMPHKNWFDLKLEKFLTMVLKDYTPKELPEHVPISPPSSALRVNISQPKQE